jgi:hypothetical protein
MALRNEPHFYTRAFVMDTSQNTILLPSVVRSHDGLIIVSYVAIAALVMLAIYFGFDGPSFADGDLSTMVKVP